LRDTASASHSATQQRSKSMLDVAYVTRYLCDSFSAGNVPRVYRSWITKMLLALSSSNSWSFLDDMARDSTSIHLHHKVTNPSKTASRRHYLTSTHTPQYSFDRPPTIIQHGRHNTGNQPFEGIFQVCEGLQCRRLLQKLQLLLVYVASLIVLQGYN
jgi:hypothetical protein